MGDLAAGGAQRERFAHRGQDIAAAFRGGAEGVEGPRHGAPVPLLAQGGEPLALVGLDQRIDAERLVRLVVVGDELVDPDHGALAIIDFPRKR